MPNPLPRWPFITLSVLYTATGLLHLVAGLFLFFVLRGQAAVSSEPSLLPLYSWLGTPGYVLFFLTIPLDFAAAACLLMSRSRRRVVITTAAVANLPLIPLGTLTAVGTFFLYWHSAR